MAEIIYEDDALLVVRKPAGVESQRGRSFAMDLESELRNELARRQAGTLPYLGVVHRLDRPVAGLMVYAKTKKAAAGLSRQFAEQTAHKVYEALVWGCPEPESGELRDWLETDKAANRTRAAAPENDGVGYGRGTEGPFGGKKEAILRYRRIPFEELTAFFLEKRDGELLIRTWGEVTGRLCADTEADAKEANGEPDAAETAFGKICAVRVEPVTGRHHQIRVQLAHAGFPIVGDTRYARQPEGLAMRGAIALSAVRLRFRHPLTGQAMCFGAEGDGDRSEKERRDKR